MTLDRRLEVAILRNLLARTTRAYEEQVAALSREKELAQVTLASIGDGVITTDPEGRVRFLNPVAETLTGWHSDEAAGRRLDEVFHLVEDSTGRDRPLSVTQALHRDGELPEAGPGRRRMLVRSDGQRFAVEHSAAPIRNAEGEVVGLVIVFQDVTDQRLLALQLAHQATHDALTGLLNRQAFDERIRALLAGGEDGGRHHCLLYMDLDQFKVVNDTCGHLAGDELLRRIAVLITEKVRDRDLVARLGGDEFGVLLPDCSLEPGHRIAERIHRAVTQYRFSWQDKRYAVGMSIGLVPIPTGEADMAQILSAADHACYVAKERGRNRIQLYQSDDAEVMRRTDEMNWVVRIHRTLEEGRFRLFAQPIRKLGPCGQAEPLFLEVLLRMVEEDDRILTPTPFVRAAERYGLMRDLDWWVVSRVLDHLDACCDADVERLGTCAVNLSAVSVSDESFLDRMRRALGERDPELVGRLCFEITETAALANLSQAQRLIQELAALGCRFALDDFGSGMASYGKLKALRVQYLKIDATFVRDLATNPLDRAMVESINQMAHVLGVRTVAEGVSGAPLLDRLESLGVDYAQGFGVARPRALDHWLPVPGGRASAAGRR